MTYRLYRGPRRRCPHCREQARVVVGDEILCWAHYNEAILR